KSRNTIFPGDPNRVAQQAFSCNRCAANNRIRVSWRVAGGCVWLTGNPETIPMCLRGRVCETSRPFARSLSRRSIYDDFCSELFRIYRTLKDHGVKLYFAEEKLDSSDEKFQLAWPCSGCSMSSIGSGWERQFRRDVAVVWTASERTIST